MSIKASYNLSCDTCLRVFYTTGEDAQEVEGLAIDDNWIVENKQANANSHTCPICIKKALKIF